MTTRRHDHRAIPRTLFSVLLALLCSQAVLLAQAPRLEFHRSLHAPREDGQTIRLGFQPATSRDQVIHLGFEEAAPTNHGPLFEYCPLVEVIQPVAYSQLSEALPTDLPSTVEPPGAFDPCLGTPRKALAHRTAQPLLWGCCTTCQADTSCADWDGVLACKRLCGGLHDCLCCPDPCYEPRWQPLVDSAFDVASVRPRTQQRLRWDLGVNLNLPDRAEFFWARADGRGRGPAPAAGTLVASNNIHYNELTYSFEAAIEKFAVMVYVPYRSIDPSDYAHAANLGDIRFGAKSVIFDCELLQIGAQLLAYAPSGNANKGLGTGHYSLEPSLLLGLRVAPETYVQAQISEWIPLRGDQDYAGAVLHTHIAINHELCRLHENWPLIATFGANTWTFQDGAYTDPVLGSNQKASGFTYCTLGPGLRLFICDKIDFGFGVQFAVTRPHFADQLYSTEFRWRF